MKIATWNVNSVKARKDHIIKWLTQSDVDVLFMQELKGLEFPQEDFSALNYHSAYVNQKAYNGVATLSKHPIKIIKTKLPGDDKDEQARYLECKINGITMINIYLPNGNPVETDKYDYKLNWMDRLYEELKLLRSNGIPFLIGGDFNIIPTEKDCQKPERWINDALFKIESRSKFRSYLNLGLDDAFRVHNNKAEQYTYWDYQRGAWQKDDGIRIDHFLLSPSITDKLASCSIDKEPRGWDKASDHTPLVLELNKNE